MWLSGCHLLAKKGSWLSGCHTGKERESESTDVHNWPLGGWDMRGKLLHLSGLPASCLSSASY